LYLIRLYRRHAEINVTKFLLQSNKKLSCMQMQREHIIDVLPQIILNIRFKLEYIY